MREVEQRRITCVKICVNKKQALTAGYVSAYFDRFKWCPGTESNRRHEDFQSSALPTELPGRKRIFYIP